MDAHEVKEMSPRQPLGGRLPPSPVDRTRRDRGRRPVPTSRIRHRVSVGGSKAKGVPCERRACRDRRAQVVRGLSALNLPPQVANDSEEQRATIWEYPKRESEERRTDH